MRRTSATETPALGLCALADYEPLVGPEAVDRIFGKAAQVAGLHVVNVSSTYYGGGVAEMLTPLTLLMNETGVKTGWRVLQGTAPFFQFTKQIHNGLQGAAVTPTEEDARAYEQVALENATRMHLEDHDVVIVHDPQPLPLIRHMRSGPACIWQCHIDLSAPYPDMWRFVSRFVEPYDVAVLSLPEYAQNLSIRQHFILPAIDPFSIKNCPLSGREIGRRLALYNIPTDLPLVVQCSRFDKWKDPQGVIEAFRIARREVPCTLVLAGNGADDDPEGQEIFEAICRSADERIIAILADDPILVNALQRAAAVVLQKSIREGFGLTVSEAMWKGACVIGGNVGGIRHQIRDGENGFLVSSVAEAAARIVDALQHPALRARLGAQARETVRQRFLMSRLMEDWLDLIASVRAARAQHSDVLES